MSVRLLATATAVAAMLLPSGALSAPFSFSTGAATNGIGMASTPAGNGFIEHEAADDFVVPLHTIATLTSGTFTGLVPAGATVQQVLVEIYRVFPLDSDTTRTPNVPTRANSPSDVEFDGRDSAVAGELSFTTTQVAATFTASNSVINGIHPKPGQTTGGEGPVTGQEVQFNVNFTTPITLPADHYFFVPQVLLSNLPGPTNLPFLWLSGQRPLTGAGGTTPFTPDLQAWIRDANLDPDWLRVGTDIVGGATPPTFNGAFSLVGTSAVPEPSSIALSGLALVAGWLARRRSRLAPNAPHA